MIVGLALTPALDVTCEVERLERGGITRPLRVTRVAGGKTLNALRAAHALGAPVHAVAALGGHSGRWVAELLRADGVTHTVVELAAATRTCTAIVEKGAAVTSTDLYEPAAALAAHEWDRFARACSDIVARTETPVTVVLSGSLPPGDGAAEATSALLADLRGAGARVVVDGSGPGLRATIDHAALVKINRAEAEEHLGAEFATAQEAARALAARTGGDVVVTDGVRGGAGVIGGELIRFAAPASPGRFPAGSGDAFLGGLLAAQSAGRAPAAAVELARSAAERNAAVPGQGVLA